MKHGKWKVMGVMGLWACLVWLSPGEAGAAEIAVETSTALYAKIDNPAVIRDAAANTGETLSLAKEGQVYEVSESGEDGWLKIKTGDREGYIEAGAATLIERTREKVDKSVLQRKAIVDYALKFVGNSYVYGGTDPNNGVDCSGFTRYVLLHTAGIGLSHNARAQSGEGRIVSAGEARPGDLVFYGKGSSINHVALYMGDGRVVHASTEKTGIMVTNVTYRKPVKFISVLN